MESQLGELARSMRDTVMEAHETQKQKTGMGMVHGPRQQAKEAELRWGRVCGRGEPGSLNPRP